MDVVDVVFERIVDDDCEMFVLRPPEFAARTAASDAPMHRKQTARKGSIILILAFIWDISKKACFGASGIYIKKQ